MTTTAESLAELDSPADVLAFARDSRVAAIHAEADLLLAAVTWAEQHPPESIEVSATWAPAGDCPLPLAGEGAPLVAEFCIAEFALAIGRSTDSGRIVIAHSLELKYRLPRLWARTQSGDLEPWRARRVAAATLGLTPEAARYVDDQVAAFAHKIGPAQLDRLVEQAVARFMPEVAEENAERAAEGRHVTFQHHQISLNGTTFLQAQLDLADALDLDAAIAAIAEELRLAGSTDSLDVRRAIAAGQLARRQLGLGLEPAAEAPDRATTPKPRQVILYVHLSEAAISGIDRIELAQVNNQRRAVLADHVRRWCGASDTEVVVKPVIDLDEHIGVAGYEVPERLAEQIQVRDGTCTFPWCTRPARTCDSDHVIAFADGGSTSSCNIAPLCRRHHRLKTHSPWTYTVIDPGTYLWSSPHGYQFLRDRHGTSDVSRE